MGISALWYDRNKLVFEGKISAPGMVAISIHKRTTEVLNCLRKNLIKEQANRSDHLIRWIPPPESIIKINVDGSFYSHNNNAACGGVFRDQEANIVADCLAKKGHELPNGLHIFDAPPPDSLHFLFSDFHGCLRLRGTI
ncbi:hypothetical protein Ahy_A07g032687 [Arachis hypogaea]|uniref:RNase H type-1 domain-containing protein n=1 Tax=Arachis hypogaea TaxID=3818 RepID=A0A445C7C3_ARAHY|nr:hypothetical protein Ahy_A07g032687 [Arachis hypogaea]